MAFLTFAGKCAGLGAMGFAGLAAAPKIRPSFKSDASAIYPSPTPQRLKKWRRVSCNRIRSSNDIVSYSLVIKSSRLNSTRPMEVHAASSATAAGSAPGEQLAGSLRALLIDLPLPFKKLQQTRRFYGSRLPSSHELVGIIHTVRI